MTHEPGIIHTWTFDQERTWIDVNGVEHDIALIDSDYAANLYRFLIKGAVRFHRAYRVQRGYIAYHEELPSELALKWILERPLVAALHRRLQHGPQTAFAVKGA